MNPELWKARWAAQQIGFHQRDTNRYLARYLSRLSGEKRSRVLVPLCGKSNDMAYLAGSGHEVVGVEVVEEAVVAFFDEHGLQPTREPRGEVESFRSEAVEILCGDFFEVTRERVGEVTCAFDRAALIALPPPLRERYVPHLVSLLPRGGSILLVSIEYGGEPTQGPPFSVSAAEIRRAFAPTCEVELLEEHEGIDDEENARFKARGLSTLVEQVWLMQVR